MIFGVLLKKLKEKIISKILGMKMNIYIRYGKEFIKDNLNFWKLLNFLRNIGGKG